MRKIKLTISMIAIIFPITTMACGRSNSININRIIAQDSTQDIFKNKFYRPFQFNELKKLGKKQPNMSNGIGYASYVHGMSFIINVMRKIGFDMFVNDAKKINGKVLNINYFNGHTKESIQKNNPEEIFKFWEKVKNNKKSRINGKDASGQSLLDPIGIDFVPNYVTIANTDFWRIWTDKVKSKVIYDPIKIKNPIVSKKLEWGMPSFWHMIDGVIKPKPKVASILAGNKIILGLEIGNYDPLNDGLAKYRSSAIRTNIRKNKKWSFNYHLGSHNNYYQGFQMLKNQNKIDEIKMLITAIIKNLNYALNTNDNLQLVKYIHPTINRLYQYIKNLNFSVDSKYLRNKTLLLQEKINNAVEDLNNGSHNMFAVEIFARGIENLPVRYMPIGNFKKVPKIGTSRLIGMANSINLKILLEWFHSTKKGYMDENEIESPQDMESMDPDTMKPYPGSLTKIRSERKLGVEIKEMGGIVEKIKYDQWLKACKDWNQKIKSSSNINLKKPILSFYDKKYLF